MHFEIHTSNMMLRDSALIIIGMGDLPRGSILFDIGLLYTIYDFPELGTCEMVTNIPKDAGKALWLSFDSPILCRQIRR